MRFLDAGGSTRTQEDRAFGEDQRRIFDEDRIREGFERRKHGDLHARVLHRRDVGIVLGLHALIGRIATVIGTQAVDDGGRRACGR